MSDDFDSDLPGDTKTRPGNAGGAAGGDVVEFFVAGGPDPVRILADLRAYWEGLRKGRAVPDRADVEPKGIRRALDYAFILERIAPGAARFRLAGRHLVDLMGMELRGMPVCSLLNPASRGRLSDVLETVFKGPQIAEVSLRSEVGYGRPLLTGRMLFLPLKSDLGDVTRALGCLVTEGQIGRGPRRFDLTRDAVFPVIEGAQPLTPNPGGFQDDAAPWRPPALARPLTRPVREDETPEERRARFRIVTENRDD